MDVPPESHTWDRGGNRVGTPGWVATKKTPQLLSLPRASVPIEPTGVEGLTIDSSPVVNCQAEFEVWMRL